MIEFTLMSVPVVSTPVPNSVAEHFDIMWLIFLAALAIIVWFAVKAFNKFEDNQKEIFNRMRKTENELSFLKGEHESMCGKVVPILTELNTILKQLKGVRDNVI